MDTSDAVVEGAALLFRWVPGVYQRQESPINIDVRQILQLSTPDSQLRLRQDVIRVASETRPQSFDADAATNGHAIISLGTWSHPGGSNGFCGRTA